MKISHGTSVVTGGSIVSIHTYAWPDVDDLHTNGGILGVLVAVPVLSTSVYFAAVRALYYVSRPNVVEVTGPGIVGGRLITGLHHYFIPIFVTNLK